MRLLRSVRDGEPSKQFGGQQGGHSFWSERDARSFHVLRERRTTVRADKHAYQTTSITSRHTQARPHLQQSLEFGDAQAQSQHLHATASAAFNERFQHTRREWSPHLHVALSLFTTMQNVWTVIPLKPFFFLTPSASNSSLSSCQL